MNIATLSHLLRRVRRSTLILLPAAAALALGACSSGGSDGDGSLYSCDEFGVWADSVVQGPYKAVAVSRTELLTTYRSAETSAASPVATFRFSVNSRDNEMPRTFAHRALIGRDNGHVYTFGSTDGDPAEASDAARADTLPVNTQWVVRVDMRPMLRAFRRDGRWVTPTGDTIVAEDFKGVWVAGSTAPMSWDFENLWNCTDRKLTPSAADDSVYEAVIAMNPPVQRQPDPHGWKVDAPSADYPQMVSDQLLPDCLYNMAISELVADIRPDDTFRAGKEWDGVWTRDVAYSIYLALAYLDPERSVNSLRAKVKDGRIVQDTGTGGAWPVSSDRAVWALAAWECYLVTGDRDWLQEAYDVIAASLADDTFTVWDPRYRLMHGEQSYLDWREQTYPWWMQPADIYQSMCLGTNVVFKQAFQIMSLMAAELGLGDSALVGGRRPEQWAQELAESINYNLWSPAKGYYASYLYGAPYAQQSPTADNLGQSLAVLFDVATPEMASSLIAKTPLVVYGTPSVTPQNPEIRPYHNNAVWPFVQAYWNLAAAKTRNIEALRAGMASIYRAAALFATNKELFVADNGDYRGTAINSDAQLWSVAGQLAMTYRVLLGMTFTADGLEFHPVVPAQLGGERRITGFRYRGATLDITVRGHGDKIAEWKLDGVAANPRLVPAGIASGHHTVEITMANNSFRKADVNIGAQQWMPMLPDVSWTDQRTARLAEGSGDDGYIAWINGTEDRTFTGSEYLISDPAADIPFTQASFSALAKAERGKAPLQSFMTRPHFYLPAGSEKLVPVDLTTTVSENTAIPLEVTVANPGEYFVTVRYANGSGPINTENKCAIRTLTVNGEPVGPIVMPQRGTGEWLSTGFSNTLVATLRAGANSLSIDYVVPQNRNMNGDVNTAVIKYVRLIRK